MPQRQKILGVDIDDAVRDALDKAAYKAGNASVLARMIGVSVGVMSQWKSDGCKRPIKVIPYKRWAIVYPHIREYLPPGDARYLPRDTQPAAAIVTAPPLPPCEELPGRQVPRCPFGCSETERLIITRYRQLDPDQQAETLIALKHAAEATQKSTAHPQAG
jgi:hypothetical protein